MHETMENVSPVAQPPVTTHATPEHSHHVPTHYSSRTGRRAVVAGVAIGLGLAAIFVLRHATNARHDSLATADLRETAAQTVGVDVVHVQKLAGAAHLTLPGEARPFANSTVFARTSGYLKNYLVDIGDRVKDGQVLATIETPELDEQIAAAKAKIQELKAEAHMARTSADFARISYDRFDKSSKDGSVSMQERDQKQSELDAATAKVEAAEASVNTAEAELRRLMTLDKFKEVTAPYDGTITDRRVDVGDLVTAGSTSNTTSLFTIAQSRQMRVLVDVPQSAASDVAVGDSAAVSCAGRQLRGRVDRTADMIDSLSRTLRVEVLVENPQHVLLPGAYVEVTFDLPRPRPAIAVPSSALVWRASGPQVAVVDSDDRVRFRDVNITRDSGDTVEVEGLAGSERIVLNLGSQAAAGEKVRPREVDEPAPPAGH